jgi:alpha-beta hydrolase superfamily lysophospholipase
MIGKIFVGLALLAGIPLVIALGLIVSQWPRGAVADSPGGLDFSAQLAGGAEPLPASSVTMSDATHARVRHLGATTADAPLVVLVHGSGWDGGQFDALALGLSRVADVLVPDLRGHGATPDRRGDVDYLGQFEDDLADLIEQYKREDKQEVILLGHSSGGGLVIRFANGPHGSMMDRAVLLAPFVQYDAPMQRPGSGGWARALTRRIVGLSMLNSVGIHALDHLTVIEFAMPETVLQGSEGHRATTAYSWRLNQSFSPRRDWRAEVAALPPFLLVAGTRDEAFVAEAYEPHFSPLTEAGEYLMVPGVGHLDIVNSARTLAAVTAFIRDE